MNNSVYGSFQTKVITATVTGKTFTAVDSANFTSFQGKATSNFLYGVTATKFLNEASDSDNVTDYISEAYGNSSQSSETEHHNITVFADYPQGLLYFGAVCFIVFAIVGAIGNLASIVALSMSKKTRNATTAFIVNLCVADFLFCSFPMPVSAITFIEKGWNYGDTLCVIFPFVRYANGAVSLFSVIAITLNRYILIGHPNIYDAVYTKRKIAIMIVSMWMFSPLFLLLPFLGVWGKLGYDPKVGTCTILEVGGKSPKTFFFIAAFILPSIVFIVCYLKIYFVVKKGSKKTKRKEDKLSGTKSSSTFSLKRGLSSKPSGFIDVRLIYMQCRKRKELKVLQVMLVVFILFVLCYFPAFFVKVFQKECDLPILNVLGYLGVYFSNIINPLIYIVMSDVYRKAYKELFCRGRTNYDSHHSASARYYASQCQT